MRGTCLIEQNRKAEMVENIWYGFWIPDFEEKLMDYVNGSKGEERRHIENENIENRNYTNVESNKAWKWM